ncbi:NADH:ubiquinone dehydrogenase subunit 5 [Nowakowskiella sp. JEL0078]|nr:NADH:ubiquinone dehydrogenase subunit 5 [Nowakowskiella sp. JEL0078]
MFNCYAMLSIGLLGFLTLREDSFDFSALINTRLANIDPLWLQWFIGFVEGDGSIITNGDGSLSFVVTQAEKAILDHIQVTLGFGKVVFDYSNDCWRYIVSDLPSIYELALLFNGNLFLEHRINQLSSWVEGLQARNYLINLINSKVLITLQDAWLSGFTDAEGCFNVTITKRAAMFVGFRVVMRFILDQNDRQALLYISNLFGFGYIAASRLIKLLIVILLMHIHV